MKPVAGYPSLRAIKAMPWPLPKAAELLLLDEATPAVEAPPSNVIPLGRTA